MATTAQLGSEKAVEKFGGAGMALLPWTRHMLMVLWDQLRLLVQVIYYSFMSVFQMFRFEVHVRITDESDPTSDPADPFLFSSLFSEDSGTGSTAEALLSSLRGEDPEGALFMGHKHQSSWKVGDWNIFVSSGEPRCSDEERSASCWSSEEEHSGLEFDSDESRALWESLSRSNDPYNPFCFSACLSTHGGSTEAFWETKSICSSLAHEQDSMGDEMGCIGHAGVNVSQEESKRSWETESTSADTCSPDLDCEELQENQSDASNVEGKHSDVCSPDYGSQCSSSEDKTSLNQKALVQMSGEENSAFWDTESSVPEVPCEDVQENQNGANEEESKDSWETESKPRNISTNVQGRKTEAELGLSGREESKEVWETEFSCRGVPVGRFWDSSSTESSDAEEGSGVLMSRSDSTSSWSSWSSENSEERENDLLWDLFTKHNDPYNPLCFSAAESRRQTEHQDEEEQLWSSLTQQHDPYHPLSFTALEPRHEEDERRRRPRGVKPQLGQSIVRRHQHPQVVHRPWRRRTPSTETRAQSASASPGPERTRGTQKKVRFSDEVLVHVMRSWPFARQASRRGLWEESARDRDRFRRRILETEKAIGPCLSPEHREGVRTRLCLD